jgi:aerobic carbon-monoxide dehydrogenase medium subunit
MIPASFDYHRPASLDEALSLLKRHGEEAKVLSGGMSLLPMMKLRLASFAHLVDINRIPGLDYIKEEKGVVRIGAMTRQSALERSEIVRAKLPVLADAVSLIADPLVRNRGTLGGNVANGDPGNDEPAIMIALGATFVARGAKERSIPAAEFYKGLYATALATGEILTEIRIPVPPPRSGGAYAKLKRKTGDFAMAAAAVQLTLGKNGSIERCIVVLTNAGATPVEVKEAGKFLAGKKPDDMTVREAGQIAAKASSPSADQRGSVEYKKEMARVMTVRALKTALERAARN